MTPVTVRASITQFYQRFLPYALAIAVLVLLTWLGLRLHAMLGLGALCMLYLCAVLVVATLARLALTLMTAISAVLLINYYFIPPTRTLQVASVQSWLLLISFALVASLASSAIQQLKRQRQQAEQTAEQSRFFQALAEAFAVQTEPHALLTLGVSHIAARLQTPMAILQLSASGDRLDCLAGDADAARVCPPSSVQWVLDFQRPLGAGTPDWPDMPYTLWPFAQQSLDKQHRSVVFLQCSQPLPAFEWVRLCLQQFAMAYFKLCDQQARLQAEQQSQNLQFKKTLLTALSHDMRTPLTVIAGAAQVLADAAQPLDKTQTKPLLQAIQSEVSALIHSTENILTLATLESGQRSLQLDWQLAEDIVQHVVQRIRTRDALLPLQVRIEHSGVLLRVDALLMAHALMNLLDNAIHWHSPDTPVQVTVSANAHRVTLAVTNLGPPITEAVQNDAVLATTLPTLQRTAHTKHATATRGFGLGLRIARHIMQAHGGELQIVSGSGNPNCVCLHIPRPSLPDHHAHPGAAIDD